MFAYYPQHAAYTRRQRYEDELELLRRQAARRAYEEELAQQEAERRRQQAAYEAHVRRQIAERQAYEEIMQRRRQRAYEEAIMKRQEEETMRRRQSPPTLFFSPRPSGPSPATQKRAAITLQRHYRAHRSAMQHLEQLAALRGELNKLKDAFIFPEQLDFLPTGKLAFTSLNAPLHGYEDALTRLLTRLDAVESGGSDTVRAGRKSIVLDIEAELSRIDILKGEAWRKREEAVAAITVPIEAASPAADEMRVDEPVAEEVPAMDVGEQVEAAVCEPEATVESAEEREAEDVVEPVKEEKQVAVGKAEEISPSPSLRSLPDASDDEDAFVVV